MNSRTILDGSAIHAGSQTTRKRDFSKKSLVQELQARLIHPGKQSDLLGEGELKIDHDAISSIQGANDLHLNNDESMRSLGDDSKQRRHSSQGFLN